MAEENNYSKAIADIGALLSSTESVVTNAASVFSGLSSAIATAGEAAEAFGIDIQASVPGFEDVIGACESMASQFESIGGSISSAAGMISGFAEKLGGLAGLGEGAVSPIIEKVAGLNTGFMKLMGFGLGLGIVVAGLGLLSQAYGTEIDSLVEMMMTRGPEIITSLCNGIITALPALMEQGALLLNTLMQAIIVNLPALLAGGFGIVSGLIMGIAQQLPMLIPTAVQLLLTLVQGLIENLPQLINSGLALITGLVQGLVNAIPILVQAAPALISSLISGIVEMLPQIILTGIQLISQLIVGLIQAIPDIVAAIPQIFNAMKQAFTDVDWGQVGSDIIKGIKNGLSSAARALVEAAAKVATDALNWVKEKLGINSPSSVFRDEVGKMMALGMGIGFKTNIPIKQMKQGLGQALDTLKGQADIAMSYAGSHTGYMSHSSINSAKPQGFDFDEFERRQRRINNERADRPVFLNGRQVNRALKKGVPVTV